MRWTIPEDEAAEVVRNVLGPPPRRWDLVGRIERACAMLVLPDFVFPMPGAQREFVLFRCRACPMAFSDVYKRFPENVGCPVCGDPYVKPLVTRWFGLQFMAFVWIRESWFRRKKQDQLREIARLYGDRATVDRPGHPHLADGEPAGSLVS